MIIKALKIVSCLLIAVLLIMVGVFSLSIGLRSYRAAVQLDDVTLDQGTVVYLASVYKMTYDGENFEEDFKAYVSDLVADAYLYTIHHGYTLTDKELVSKIVKGVLDESANGRVTVFNDVAAEHGYGFTYTDFKNAIGLKYKAEQGKKLMPEVLGEEGYANAKTETIGRISFTDRYSQIDYAAIPDGHEYYVK